MKQIVTRKLVTLTAAGHDAIATAERILCQLPAAIRSLSVRDLDRLIAVMRHVVDAEQAEEEKEC